MPLQAPYGDFGSRKTPIFKHLKGAALFSSPEELDLRVEKRMSINFLTVQELAQRLKLSPASIRRSIREGKIYASRPSMGKKAPYRIAESELERLQLQGMCEKKK